MALSQVMVGIEAVRADAVQWENTTFTSIIIIIPVIRIIKCNQSYYHALEENTNSFFLSC